MICVGTESAPEPRKEKELNYSAKYKNVEGKKKKTARKQREIGRGHHGEGVKAAP